MDKKEKQGIYGKYYKKFLIEAWVRSLVAGLIVGCGVQFIGALIGWFTPWIHGRTMMVLGITLAALIATTLLAFFFLYKPTEEKMARRIDRLGFDERFVTMRELQGDTSFIATAQRADTERAAAGTSLLPRVMVSLGMLIAAIVLFCCGTGMHIVTGLSESGRIPSGQGVRDRIKGDTYYEVLYEIDEDSPGGYIDGDPLQLVSPGGETNRVIAVADEGWQFDKWSDGSTDPVRTDANINEDTVFIATFVAVEESDDGGENGDSDSDDDTEQPPQENQDNNQSQGGQEGPAEDQATGIYEQGNYVIDGETYYRDVLEAYYQEAMKILAEGGEIDDDMRAIIELYYEIIG